MSGWRQFPTGYTLCDGTMTASSKHHGLTHMYCICRSGSVSSCSTLPPLIQRWPRMSMPLLFKEQVSCVLEPTSWTEVLMVPAEAKGERVS